jgi:hypothetical protein
MARDLWLWLVEYLDEVADTEFLIAHQVEETQTRFVAKRLKEALHVECRGFCCHKPKYTP